MKNWATYRWWLGEMALILEVQTDEFWQDITLPMLETVLPRLRALVKLIEYKKRPLVYSDFEDRADAAIGYHGAGHCGRHRHGLLSAGRRGCSSRPHENHIAVIGS